MTSKDVLEDFYERKDPWGFDDTPEDRVRSAILLDFVREGGFERGLDIGCAEGRLTERVAAHVGRVDAFDLSERAVERARARGLANVTFFALDMRDLDQLDGTYDLILCSEVLYYLPDAASRARALDSIRAKLAPGGVLLMSTIVVGSDGANLLGERYFTFDEARGLLATHFRIVRVVPNVVRRRARRPKDVLFKGLGRLVPAWRDELTRHLTETTPPRDAYQVAFVCVPRDGETGARRGATDASGAFMRRELAGEAAG